MVSNVLAKKQARDLDLFEFRRIQVRFIKYFPIKG